MIQTTGVSLHYYIDQLAEYIVAESEVNMCKLCIRSICDSQQSGLTCRHGVKAFLQSKQTEFAESLDLNTRHNAPYYDYLDRRDDGEPLDVKLGALTETFPDLTSFRAHAIVMTWHTMKEVT